MLHRLTRVIALVVLLAIAAGLMFAPAVSAQEQNSAIEDGEIVQCGMISEDGNYEVSRDFEHDGSSVCLNVTAGTVTIEDGTLQGDRDSSIGIQTNGDRDGKVTLRNVRMEHWGETALHSNWNGQPFVVENSEFVTNTHVLQGTEAGGFEMYDSEVRNTYSTAIYGQRMGTVIIHDSTFTGGGGSAFSTIDGAGVEIRGSEFRNNDGTALAFAHSTRAEVHNSDISDNGGNGISATSSGMGISVEVYDSTITNNDEHGVNAYPFWGPNPTLYIEDTEIDDNGGLAVRSLKDSEPHNEPGVSASNLDLGGGLVVSFEDQTLDLSTEAAHDHETDALVFDAPADADIEGEFTTGGESGTLWAQMDDGWQQRGTYDSGTFTEVVGPNTWAASGSEPSTPEPTPTPNNTPEPTDEPTDEPEQPDTSTDTPTNTDSDIGGSGIESSTETRTPSNSQPAVEPEPRTTRTDTDIPSDSATDTETETTRGETATENETEMPATDDNTETTTMDDTTSSGDGGSPLQWYGIAVAIILLLATFTASLVTWE